MSCKNCPGNCKKDNAMVGYGDETLYDSQDNDETPTKPYETEEDFNSDIPEGIPLVSDSDLDSKADSMYKEIVQLVWYHLPEDMTLSQAKAVAEEIEYVIYTAHP